MTEETNTPELEEEWDGTLWLDPLTVTRILEMPEPDDKEGLDALREKASTPVSKG